MSGIRARNMGRNIGRNIGKIIGIAACAWALPAQALWMYTPFDTNTASTMQGILVGGPNVSCDPDGNESTFDFPAPFVFNNNNPNEPHLYQAYTLYNNGPARCVRVRPVWTHQDCGNIPIGVSLYLGSFNPADPTENLLAHSYFFATNIFEVSDLNSYRHSPGYYYTDGINYHLDDQSKANAVVPELSTVVVVLDSMAQPGDNLQCPINNATSSFGITSDQLSNTPLTVEVHDTSSYEGNPPGGGTLSFYVWLSTQFDGTFTVDYSTTPGSATAADFTATSGQLTFLPGETVKVVQVPIIGDLDIEPNEMMTLTLSNPSSPYVTLAQASATGTIYDDDDLAGTCHIVNYTGGDLPIGTIGETYTPGGPVDLQPDGNQDPADDYEWTITAGSLPPGINLSTFTGGDTELWGRLSGTPTQAGTYDFTVRLRCPLAPDPGWDTYEVPFQIVVEPDVPPAIITLTGAQEYEGNSGLTPAAPMINLSQALADNLQLEVLLFDGSAMLADNDYVQLLNIPQLIQINAGETQVPIPLEFVGDTTVENDETFLVQLRTVASQTVIATGTVTVLNDDAPVATPTLAPWGLGLLAGMLGMLGMRFRRKG
ncbi:MAG: Calx-beta domain-containing protein [Chromatiales bacterium]|nr:Calx-beta domain-containing protein [Chromatiales bacterium]